MVESVSIFPLPKLRQFTILTLDVMMHVEFEEACKFMFSISKEGRSFLFNNLITIGNGFINDGLFPFEWKDDFNSYF
jgi:hypothetical protein